MCSTAKIEGSLVLGNGFYAEGLVDLSGTSVGVAFWCDSATIVNPRELALNCRAMRIGNRGSLKDSRVEGSTDFTRASIGGDLDCESSTFVNHGKVALQCEAAEIGKSVTLSNKFTDSGIVNLSSAVIGGDLNCSSSTFAASGDSSMYPLSCDFAQVHGSVLLVGHFHSEGGVNLSYSKIGEHLICRDASIINPGKIALNCQGTKVQSDLQIDSAFRVDGEVEFRNIEVGGTLDCRGFDVSHGTISKYSLDLQFAKVGITNFKKSFARS